MDTAASHYVTMLNCGEGVEESGKVLIWKYILEKRILLKEGGKEGWMDESGI